MRKILSVSLIFLYSACAASVKRRSAAHLPSITFRPGHEYTLNDNYEYYNEQSIFNIVPHAQAPAHGVDDSAPTSIALRARPTSVWRPRDSRALEHARQASLGHAECEPVEWERVDVLGPDVEDRHTLGQLARMTGNAYALPGRPNWYEIDQAWNTSFPFGWEDAADGFRGHVFIAPDNATVVLSIKGTTLQGPTSKKDKFNDNLMFSCCCARVDISWVFSTVCDCYAKNWRCDNQCLSNALVKDSLFYNIGVNLINNLTSLYPYANIWLIGHSLGGSLASLLGTTFGFPAVAFEAPGERMTAQRLHLPLPPWPESGSNFTDSTTGYFGSAPVTHVYHNADPIPQGVCTGVGSPCASAGFALETRCHLGKSVVYDAVGKLGWRVDVRKHIIKEVIHNVVEREVDGGWEQDDDGYALDVPVARVEDDCVDCFKWEFGDFGKA